MPKFITELDIRDIDGTQWKVLAPLIYETESDVFGQDASTQLCVPAGFITDFASIPRVFWRILPPTGKYNKAAVVHDYLYSTQMVTQKLADLIFYEAMGVLDVPKWKRATMYRALRMFGWVAWNNHKKEKEALNECADH